MSALDRSPPALGLGLQSVSDALVGLDKYPVPIGQDAAYPGIGPHAVRGHPELERSPERPAIVPDEDNVSLGVVVLCGALRRYRIALAVHYYSRRPPSAYALEDIARKLCFLYCVHLTNLALIDVDDLPDFFVYDFDAIVIIVGDRLGFDGSRPKVLMGANPLAEFTPRNDESFKVCRIYYAIHGFSPESVVIRDGEPVPPQSPGFRGSKVGPSPAHPLPIPAAIAVRCGRRSYRIRDMKR